MKPRGVAAAVVASLLVMQIVRNADALSVATGDGGRGYLFGEHPQVEISRGMSQIAVAARQHRQVPAGVFNLMGSAAVKAPLAPEPFLVRGVQAELTGDMSIAERAFRSAQWRDPRSLPAAYFLADRYLRVGDVNRGLPEVAALARLSPGGSTAVAPYLAAFASAPANWPALRRLFRDHQDLAGPTLTILARDPSAAPAVLALADTHQSGASPPWLAPLLNSLISVGDYARAQAIWSKTSGVQMTRGIHDDTFSDSNSPPPFNWALTASATGLAERQPGGRLHVVFYGQQDGILADELVLLRPGRYRVSMQVTGDMVRAKALNWSVWCDKAPAPISSVTLDTAARGWAFVVPQNCPAQWLRLAGSSSDVPQQTEVTVAGLKLEKADTGA